MFFLLKQSLLHFFLHGFQYTPLPCEQHHIFIYLFKMRMLLYSQTFKWHHILFQSKCFWNKWWSLGTITLLSFILCRLLFQLNGIKSHSYQLCQVTLLYPEMGQSASWLIWLWVLLLKGHLSCKMHFCTSFIHEYVLGFPRSDWRWEPATQALRQKQWWSVKK